MKSILLIFFLFVLISCKHQELKSNQTIQDSDTSDGDSLKYKLFETNRDSLDRKRLGIKKLYQENGIKELHAFEERYETKWKVKPKKFPYSEAAKIKVFELDCMGECGDAPFTRRISKGTEISKEDFKYLVNLLENPKSYNSSTAGCYDPKFGLVVYDKDDIPTEYLGICLGCNNFSTYPGRVKIKYENEFLYGFSKETRKELRNLFNKWGINYNYHSELFD